MPQVIAHPVYGEVEFPDNFDNKQIFEAFQNLDKMGKQGAANAPAPKQATPSTALDVASDIAIETGVSAGGQLAGALTGPGYFVIAPASGVYGNYLKQQQQIARGEKKDVSVGELVAAGLINLLPGVSAGKALSIAGINLAAKSTAAKVGYTAGLRAAEGAGIAAGAKTVEEYIDTGSFPTFDDYLSAVATGGVLGGAVGGAEAGVALGIPKLSKNASKMWNTLAGKQAGEVGQTLDNLSKTGTEEQKAAASEILSEVGQRLGLRAEDIRGGFGSESIRPVPAPEVPVPTGGPSAKVDETGVALGLMQEPAPRSAAEVAASFGITPATTSARALLGDEAVDYALKQANLLPSAQQQANLIRSQAEQARIAAEANALLAMRPEITGGFGSEAAAMAGTRPSPTPQILGTLVEPRPLGGFGGTGAQGTPVVYPRTAAESAAVFEGAVAAEAPQTASLFERAYQEGQTYAGAAGLRERLLREEQESMRRVQDFDRARAELQAQQVDETRRAIEAARLNQPEQVTFSPESLPEEVTLNVLDTRPGQAARERARINKQLGKKPEESLPTSAEVLEEMAGLPGIKGRAGAREMGLQGGMIPPDVVLPLASLAAGEAAQDQEGTTPAERAVYAALAVGAAAVAGRKMYKKALARVDAKAATVEEALAARNGVKPVTVSVAQATKLPSDTDPKVQKTLKELNVPAPQKPKTLEDVDRLFGEAKEDSKFLTVGDRAAELFQNSFRPLAVLEQKIRGVSPKINLADKFSLIGGAGGKAEPAITEMEQVRRSLVGDIHPKDINRYFALNRASDRLQRGIVTGGLSIEDTQRLLADLGKGLGPDKIDRLDKFAQYMQQSADADLQLMVSSGRISQKLYDDIKATNDFYAPFHFTNKIGELDLLSQRSRSGQPIDTQAELAKELVGLNDKDLKLGDIFTAFKRNKYNAHILAEKSAAMKELVEVAMMDKDGIYAKFVKSPANAPRNMETVAYLDQGKTKYIAVDPSVARAISGLSPIELGVVGKLLQVGGLGLRTGATTLNAAWLSKNLPLDFLRQMTMSKYGIREPQDLLPWSGYSLDTISALGSAIQAHLPGRFKNITPLYKAYLDSGAARSTFQSVINEDAFTKAVLRGEDGTVAKLIDVADKYILSTPNKIANAIEDTVKLMGLKRGMRFENVDKLTPEARAKMMQEIAYEVRNYAGSPDFAKFGSLGRQTNLLLMFANARAQGVAADLGRLAGRTGSKEARDAWVRVGILFGLPAAALWSVNHTPENIEDYNKLSERDKVNFFNIPMYDENGPKYNTDKYGRKVRDYLRFPKRDVSSLMSNTIDKALDFYGEQSPEAVYEWANAMADSISPVSISGRTPTERGMSVLSSLNPALKVPIEQITNVNLFRKGPLVGRDLQELSPQYQYEESTPEVYKSIAQAVPGVSPLRLQSAVEGMTGGAFSQFVKKPQEGRNELASNPLLSSYFRSGTLDESIAFQRLDQLRTQQSDRAFIREMEINKALEAALALPKEQRQAAMRASLPRDIVSDPAFGDTLVRLVIDNRLKVTPLERRTRTLQPSERAQYIYETMTALKTDDQKRAYISRQLTIPGMVTDDVAVYLKRWQQSKR